MTTSTATATVTTTKPKKPVAPSAKNLNAAVADVLKNYQGPVDVSIITTKIKKEHPEWKLQDRRVKKFVRRHTKGHKNPAGADEDATAAMSTMTKSRMGSSLLRIFSPGSSSRRSMSSSKGSTSLNGGSLTAPPPLTATTGSDGGEKKLVENSTPNSSVPPSPISEEGEGHPEQQQQQQQQPKSLKGGQDVSSHQAVDGQEDGAAVAVDPTKIAYETDDNDKDLASSNPNADFCDACAIM